jgi:hypothetical protein
MLGGLGGGVEDGVVDCESCADAAATRIECSSACEKVDGKSDPLVVGAKVEQGKVCGEVAVDREARLRCDEDEKGECKGVCEVDAEAHANGGRANVLLLKLAERETGRERAVFEGDEKRLDAVGRGDEGRESRDGGVEVVDAGWCMQVSVVCAGWRVFEFKSKVKKWRYMLRQVSRRRDPKCFQHVRCHPL